jgi:hypothetical protein
MRDVESLCEKAGLGKLSKSAASRMCEELKERFEAFKRRDLYDTHLVAPFLDATYVSVRPSGPKQGVLVAWGFTEEGERVLLSVMLGMRESHDELAGARPRPDRPRPGVADADRGRRRSRADQSDRAVLAGGGSSALLCPPRSQPVLKAARAGARPGQARLLASTRRRDLRAGRRASDIITEAGGRVVKLIGDEAMFVFPTPEGAARGAIELVDACAAGDLPSARAGLSLGPVLARGGDYFGRAVNLASRLVDVAPPDTVLADDRFAETIADNSALAIEPYGHRRLKGLGSVHASRLRSAGIS